MQKYEVGKKFSFGHFLVVIIAIGFIFYIGYSTGLNQNSQLTGSSSVVNRQINASNDLDFALFWQVWDTVKNNHFDQPVDERELFYGAIRGMVSAIGDPYSNYFDPDLARQFNQDLEGSFYGIGAEIGLRDGLVTIISPLSGSPAEKAGLQSGDKILAVDEEDATEWTVHKAVSKIRGELGVPVTLTILREGEEDVLDIEITRDEIIIESVVADDLGDGILHIQVRQFNEETTRYLNQITKEALQGDLRGIVLDFRNNPGGLLGQALNVADFWIDDKVVTIERTRHGDIPLSSNSGAILADIPTVVLVNGGSASASEILAGALQDYSLAKIIGEQTFGKGSVQEYRTFPDGSAVKVTIAKWLTPNEHFIDEVGIMPDQIVELTLEQFNVGEDPQLEAALDYLKKNR